MESASINIIPQLVQILSNSPNSSFINYRLMIIGNYNCQGLFRVLMKFPLDLCSENIIILKASLKVNFLLLKKFMPSLVNTYAILDDWDITTVNWNNQPIFSESITGTSVYVTKTSEYELDITKIVNKWKNEEIPNFGIMLKNDESVNNAVFYETRNIHLCNHLPSINIIYAVKNNCYVEPTKFIEAAEELPTNNEYTYSSIKNTSLTKTVTFFISNIGDYPVTVNIQISPDSTNFTDETFKPIVYSGEKIQLVPMIFTKYARIAAKSINMFENSTIRIWYQAQE